MLDDMALCHCRIRAAAAATSAAAVTNRATENENISSICIAREGSGADNFLAFREYWLLRSLGGQVNLAAQGIGFGQRPTTAK